MQQAIDFVTLKSTFGKPAYRSLTAWGVLLFIFGGVFAEHCAELGLLEPNACATFAAWHAKLGLALAAIGIRRRQP